MWLNLYGREAVRHKLKNDVICERHIKQIIQHTYAYYSNREDLLCEPSFNYLCIKNNLNDEIINQDR